MQLLQVLHVMPGTHSTVSANVMGLLVSTGLLDQGQQMTDKGFQFLLKDLYSQLWIILLSYVRTAEVGSFVAPMDAKHAS